jgi:Tol biopolymer transport system component
MIVSLAMAALLPIGVGHEACCPMHVYLPELDETQAAQPFEDWPNSAKIEPDSRETKLKNIRQLTFGGQNAEAYWSKDGKKITFQSRQPGFPDEQIFTMNADGSKKKLMSTGLGRTTCSYFTPDGKWLYFSSTHAKDPGPQAPVDMSKGYVWMVNPNFSMYKVKADGTGLRSVVSKKGYVAETTIAPNGKFMTFTSNFEGDLEIYRSDLNGKNLKRLTNSYGYDGGPFVSWDSKKIVYRRAPDFKTREERLEYQGLLMQNLVRPSTMEIWVMDADGSHKRQVTHLGGANFAPFMHPNGKQIIFCSNYEDPKGREFDIYMIGVDGKGLQRLTFTPEFDGFPMITRDGKRLIFASNRNGKVHGETNLFTADLMK